MALAAPTGIEVLPIEEVFQQRIEHVIPQERREELYDAVLNDLIEATRRRIERLQDHGQAINVEEQVDFGLHKWLEADPLESAYGRYFISMRRNGVVPYQKGYFRMTTARSGVGIRWLHIEKHGLKTGARVYVKGRPKESFVIQRIQKNCHLVLDGLSYPVPSTHCQLV